MDRADPLQPQTFIVSLRPVAFVFFKGISRINFRVFHHHSVSCDLGYDRCSCNGQHLGIPFYDGLLRQIQFLDLDCVKQQIIQRIFTSISKLLFQIVLMTMMVPMEVGLVAFAWEMRILHLSKTFLPLILPNIANAFGVFWMTQYMKDSFPYELVESGRIDGCNDMGVFLRLVMPIIRPAIFTLGIISFLQSWNSYLLPMIMINNPKMYTVPLVIASIGNMFVANYGARMLGVVIGILPIILLFIIFSRQITEGLAAGAVKG